MYRWYVLTLWCALGACTPEIEVDEDPADAGQPAVESPMPALTHARVYPACGEEGLGVLVLVLSDRPGCAVNAETARVELAVAEGAALPFPLEAPLVFALGGDAPVHGQVVRDGAIQPIVGGELRIERFSVYGDAEGTYEIVVEGGEPMLGVFAAQVCTAESRPGGDGRDCYPYVPRPEPEPDPEPRPEPGPEPGPVPEPPAPLDDLCPGTYVVTDWTIDALTFDRTFVNTAITRNLAEGDLLLDMVFSNDNPHVRITDMVQNGDERAPDPAVPRGAAITLVAHGDGSLGTGRAGRVLVRVGPFLEATGEVYAPATIFSIVLAEVEGSFSPDCAVFEGRLDGAFADRPEYTIPAPHDADTNGDGTNDGWWVGSTLRASVLAGPARRPRGGAESASARRAPGAVAKQSDRVMLRAVRLN